MKRIVAIPARYLPSLDAALNGLMADIEAGRIPEWGQDDVPAEVHLLITIERPEPEDRPLPPVLKLVGTA